MIGRARHVVIHCPDPAAPDEFYAELVGWPVTYRRDDFVVYADTTTSGFAFQGAPDHVAPPWPDPDRPSRCTST